MTIRPLDTAKQPTKAAFDLLAAASKLPPIAPIEHVFVLMLENRSFDHLFGLTGIHGAQVVASTGFAAGASDRLAKDLPHEYEDAKRQIADGAMTGFAGGAVEAMRGFALGELPVLHALAQGALLMDNWFSSMPGPTWPNRFFAHAASSGGLDNSPGGIDIAQAVNSPVYSYRFEGGHIFERLVREGRSWRVYHCDIYPQVLALRGMVEKRFDRTFFRPFFQDFAADLADGYDVHYTFIEPSYDALGNYTNGNSQHPLGSVAAGEALVREAYTAIFSQPAGAKSVMLVLWDEHGGFFDHVQPPGPPAVVPPGDEPFNYDRAANPQDCKFDRFGVRVPALLVSPWLPAGLGSQIFKDQIFDHSSIISSLRMLFALGEPLNARDAAAPSWYTALLPEPRALPALLPQAPQESMPIAGGAAQPAGAGLLGTFEIAVKLDWDLAGRTAQQPLLASEFRTKLAGVKTTAGVGEGGALTQEQTDAIVDYLAAVHAREVAYGSGQA